MRWRNSGATALPCCWCSLRCWWWGWRREAPYIKSASSPNPFVLSLSKHRPSSVAPKERTTLRQAQGERFILTHYALRYSAASTSSAPPRSTETRRLTPRSITVPPNRRAEERRVGTERASTCQYRGSPYH